MCGGRGGDVKPGYAQAQRIAGETACLPRHLDWDTSHTQLRLQMPDTNPRPDPDQAKRKNLLPVTFTLSLVTCHFLRVVCHVSLVTCRSSRVTCPLSLGTCNLELGTCNLSMCEFASGSFVRAAPRCGKAHVSDLKSCTNCAEHTQSAGHKGTFDGMRIASVSLLLTKSEHLFRSVQRLEAGRLL